MLARASPIQVECLVVRAQYRWTARGSCSRLRPQRDPGLRHLRALLRLSPGRTELSTILSERAEAFFRRVLREEQHPERAEAARIEERIDGRAAARRAQLLEGR